MSMKVVIVGGHGKVALRLARQLSPSHRVTSIIRDPGQAPAIENAGATPLVLSLADAPVGEFTAAFTGADTVYFSAGAGGKGGDEMTKKIDYEGAVKVFDALEGVTEPRPLFIHVSSVDVRDPQKIPPHYTEQDVAASKAIRAATGQYFHWKYEADKILVQRSAFKWVILRPGLLTEDVGTGTASVGRVRNMKPNSRDDVAKMLSLLVDRKDAAGLAIEMAGGDTPLQEGLDAFIKKGETDWLG